jgi:putative endonuclease
VTYYVYILASKLRVLYVGVTRDLERRVLQHQQELIPGFTSKYKVHQLVYYEAFGDIRAAIAREKQIKAWRREKKLNLIESANPKWKDLSAELFGGRTAAIKKRTPEIPRADGIGPRNDGACAGRR